MTVSINTINTHKKSTELEKVYTTEYNRERERERDSPSQ